MVDLKEWQDLTLEDEMQETIMLASHIAQKVAKIGKENAVNKIIKGLNVNKVKSEVEKHEIRERVTYYLDNLQSIHLFNTFHYGNDVARALALKLDILKMLSINKHNIISFHADNRQYDPQKNGLNILKHGLSFDEVFSTKNGVFGELLVTVFEDGDERQVVFTRASSEDKYIVSIVKFHSAEEGSSEVEQEVIRITEEVTGRRVDTDGVSIEKGLTQKELEEIMHRASHLHGKFRNTPPMTFISSWYFDVNNFNKTVTDRIRFTGDHDVTDPKVAANEMKQRALVILKNAWSIDIK